MNLPPITSALNVVDYIACSEFDKFQGIVVNKQYPLNMPLISNQLDNLTGLIMPTNLHKYLNKEHYTLVILYMDPQSGLLSYTKDSRFSIMCYLYSLSYFKNDDSYRNGTAKGVSILTSLPFFEIFKPLMTYILHDSFRGVSNALLELTFTQINSLPLHNLMLKLTPASRFLLTRSSLKESQINDLFPNFKDSFNITLDLIKLSIDLTTFKFPIQIPLLSCISSRSCQFGMDLSKGSNYRLFITILHQMKMIYPDSGTPKLSSMIPYADIRPIQVIFNAMLLKKKVLIYCYDSCYNKLMDFITTLYLLFEEDSKPDQLSFYPILDLATLHLIENVNGLNNSYLVGTSNLLFKERLDWDLYIDLDLNEISLKDSQFGSDSETLNSEEIFSGDEDYKRASVLSNAETKFKQFFKRRSASIPNSNMFNSTSDNNNHDHDNFNGFDDNDNLATWSPDNFPRISATKTMDFFKPDRDSNFFQFGFSYKLPNFNNKSKPKIDIILLNDLSKLLDNKHEDDKTIYITLINYLIRMKSFVVSSLNLYVNQSKLLNYKTFVSLKLEEDEYSSTTTTIPTELKNFIKQQKLVQSLPLAYKFETGLTLPNDSRLQNYYQRIIMDNGQLLRFARLYSEKESMVSHHPPSPLTPCGNGNELFYFTYNDLLFSLDPYYLSQFIDDLLSAKFSWQLNKFKAYQLFRLINLLLKKSIDNLQILLMFFQLSPTSSTSFKMNDLNYTKSNSRSSSLSSNFNSNSSSIDGIGLDRVNTNGQHSNGNNNNNNNNNNTMNGNGNGNGGGMNGGIGNYPKDVELSLDKFNKLLIISSTYLSLSKDELLSYEFKRFLSLVLNCEFFKRNLILNVNDFVKLCINDFIDYHM